jgi:glycosyltransferase involved in cell wall biosynthesis
MKRIFTSIIIFSLCSSIISYSHILIITHSYNRPDFIEVQYQTFRKFLMDEYEFVVFNDAPEDTMAQAIETTCKNLNIQCIRIPQTIHTQPYLPNPSHDNTNNPSKRAAHVVQYSLDVLGFDHTDLVVIIDSDMFLIDTLSFREYMADYSLAGIPQYRDNGQFIVDYLWNGLVIFDMPTLPDKKEINFNCGYVEGVRTDTGGETHYYLKNHPHLPIKHIDCNYVTDYSCNRCAIKKRPCTHNSPMLKNLLLSPAAIWLIQKGPDRSEFYGNRKFFHYRSGTNWNNRSRRYHNKKTKIFETFIKKLLS